MCHIHVTEYSLNMCFGSALKTLRHIFRVQQTSCRNWAKFGFVFSKRRSQRHDMVRYCCEWIISGISNTGTSKSDFIFKGRDLLPLLQQKFKYVVGSVNVTCRESVRINRRLRNAQINNRRHWWISKPRFRSALLFLSG